MTNRNFTPGFPILAWVEVAAFVTLSIVVAIRLRQRGPLVSLATAGLVLFTGASQAIEFLFGFACVQLHWEVVALGFLRKSNGWQLGWLIAKLAVVGFFSFGLVRGPIRPAAPLEGTAVHAP